MNRELRVAGIVNDSIVDGPGLRMAIFMQGCDKRCAGCHNPETQPIAGGTPYTPNELFERVHANSLLRGVTFTGGEPLLQADSLLHLAKKIKDAGLDLAIYTGDSFEEILAKNDSEVLALLTYADALIDGPYVEKLRTLALPFRGSSNQRVLNPAESIVAERAVLLENPAWGGY